MKHVVMGLGLASLFALAGCPDAEGEFCAFDDRSKTIKNNGDGVGSCESVAIETSCPDCMVNPTDAEVTGDYLFVLSTNIAPQLPFLFSAQLTLADGDLTMVVEPLDRFDRSTSVGAPFTIGPIPLGGGFCIDQELPTIDVPGDANAVSGTDASAQVQLVGSVCGPGDFICGTIPTGTAVVGGADLDITGSTFTLTKLSAPGMLPDPLIINCDMEEAGDAPTP